MHTAAILHLFLCQPNEKEIMEISSDLLYLAIMAMRKLVVRTECGFVVKYSYMILLFIKIKKQIVPRHSW